jgi:hypothetical protein
MASATVSPLIMKGAILVLDPNIGVPLYTINLQYNPENMRRSLQPQSVGDLPDRSEVLRLKGPPIETIQCDVEIDATDLLEIQDPSTMAYGISPQLSLLELLVYPASSLLIANEVLSLIGTIEILPVSSNLTVFAWGPNRVAPVVFKAIEITEDAFDPHLNPIRAKVSLTMRVLNINDVGFLTPAGAMYMAYQMGKESIAQQ